MKAGTATDRDFYLIEQAKKKYEKQNEKRKKQKDIQRSSGLIKIQAKHKESQEIIKQQPQKTFN